MDPAIEPRDIELSRVDNSKPSSRHSGIDVEAVHNNEKYAVYGNVPLVENESKGLLGRWQRMINWMLLEWSIESRGILPIPPEHRTDPDFVKIFFLFLSANLNILSFSAGTLGPLVFGINLPDSVAIIVTFNILGNLLPAYFATFGPKLGLRQMCQARYSFGFWGATVPAFLNSVTMFGFMVLNCILGGETLSSASVMLGADGLPTSSGMSWDVGIVIISIISLVISFCGYRVLNIYERVAWIPALVVYVIALGVSGKYLVSSSPALPSKSTAPELLTFGASIAGFVISYCPLSSDFTSYMLEGTPSIKVFTCTFFGLYLPTTLVQILGAAFAAALTADEQWSNVYNGTGLTGLLHVILLPAGEKFSRFLLVLLAFSVTANIAPTLYSFSLSAQTTLPFSFIVRVPRFLFSLFATAVLVPVSIVGATHFYDALTNFLGLISYWSACFGAVVTIEHVFFRGRTWARYDVRDWDAPAKLPPGVAAIASGALGVGIATLCMDQVWFVGPVAKKTGDIGFELGFMTSAISYLALRGLEIRLSGR